MFVLLYFSVSQASVTLVCLYVTELADVSIKMCICSITTRQMALPSPLFLITFSFSPRKGPVSSRHIWVYPDSREAIRDLHCHLSARGTSKASLQQKGWVWYAVPVLGTS